MVDTIKLVAALKVVGMGEMTAAIKVAAAGKVFGAIKEQGG